MRLQATVIATTAVALALALTAGVLVWVLQGSLRAAADDDARRKVTAVVHAVQAGEARPPLPDGAVLSDPGAAVPGAAAEISGAAASGVAGPGVAGPDVVVGQEPAAGWEQGFSTVTASVGTGQSAVLVTARSPLAPLRTALDALRLPALIGLPALLALVASLTWILIGRALAPVTAIRQKFTEITASDLHQRVPVPPARDEVARLAVAMNATLDRLETAVRQHRRFVADAAHELRSPIATLRTRLELGRATAPELAGEALVDVGRVQSLAGDLLLLARLDAGEPPRTENVDLGQAAAEAAAEAAMRSGRPGVRLDLDIAPDVVVAGVPSQLGRLVGNLADNALRHATSAVLVRVTPEAVVEVCDDGPGIPPERRDAVFDRFTRLDEARARDSGGSGLGLAIARDIARAHGGTLVVATDRPAPPDTDTDTDTDTGTGTGTCLRLTLKLAPHPTVIMQSGTIMQSEDRGGPRGVKAGRSR